MSTIATPSSGVTALVVPPAPPRIPFTRRAGRTLFRWWPFVVWVGALATAAYLFSGLTVHGQALAHEASLELLASPSVPGRIADLAVELGASVEEGDVIATLDARDVDARLAFARKRVERSRMRIDAVRAELEVDARDRRAQAIARRARYESEGRRIRAAVERLEAEQSTDRAELDAVTPQIDRLRPLAEGNLIRLDRLEELLQTSTVLEARLSSYPGRIRSAREELELWRELAPVDVVESDIATRLVPFELELEAQEAHVAELLLEREKYTVRAPASGVVAAVLARPGEWRGAGEEIARIVAVVPGRMTAYLPPAHARLVEPGAVARLVPLERSGDAVEGRVLRVGPHMELVPPPLRAIPTIPEWGRRVAISFTSADPALPGEVYSVRFR